MYNVVAMPAKSSLPYFSTNYISPLREESIIVRRPSRQPRALSIFPTIIYELRRSAREWADVSAPSTREYKVGRIEVAHVVCVCSKLVRLAEGKGRVVVGAAHTSFLATGNARSASLETRFRGRQSRTSFLPLASLSTLLRCCCRRFARKKRPAPARVRASRRDSNNSSGEITSLGCRTSCSVASYIAGDTRTYTSKYQAGKAHHMIMLHSWYFSVCGLYNASGL